MAGNRYLPAWVSRCPKMRAWDRRHEQHSKQPKTRRQTGSHSLTSQPDDLDQQEAPDQQGRESDKPKNPSPHRA
jgi:hypothetical protein